MFAVFRFLLLFIFITVFAASLPSQEKASGASQAASGGSLAELRDKQRVWLIVRRTAVLDARGAESSVLSEAYRDVKARQSFPRTYNMIARRLNKYMKEHGGITAAMNVSDAEFIIFFNVLEIRRPLGIPYPYGEMFVIINQESSPRIIWKTKGSFVDDAMDEFISELKASRGYR